MALRVLLERDQPQVGRVGVASNNEHPIGIGQVSVRILYNGETCGGIVVRCDGVVTGRELVEANDLVSTEPKQRYQLWDFTDTRALEITFDEIHKLAVQDANIDKDSELQAILIVGSSRTLENLTQAYESFSSKRSDGHRPFNTKMLGTVSEARAWLSAELGITEFD